MNRNGETWVRVKRWRERWDVVSQLPGGGQGEAFQARCKTDGREAFLKVIKVQSDPERRARFFREASAYDTFRLPSVPHLIESNAHLHKDFEFEPYIATDFVKGLTLREWREDRERVDLESAVAGTLWLLTTLDECHKAGCVHRDIKPDNIIFVGGDPAQGMLLDFGLSFHEVLDVDLNTELVQEIGNRFLRLPELSAGSLLKQDPRSDITFAVGVLFYLLTGEHPNQLLDAEGRLPHQRSPALAVLQDVAGNRYVRLASLFDDGFAPQIANRFAKTDAIIRRMTMMMEEPKAGLSPQEDLRAIMEVINTTAEQRRIDTHRRLAEAVKEIGNVHREIQKSLHGGLGLSETGYGISGDSGTYTFFWTKLGSDERLMTTKCEVIEAGDEIVIRLSGETVYRSPIAASHYGEEFRQAIEEWLLGKLRGAIAG